jgi:hypothetical protein
MTHLWLHKSSAPTLSAFLLFAALAGAQVAPPPPAASALVAGAKSHLFGGQYDPHDPAAMPAAVKPEWAGLIGEYGAEMARFYVLEDQGELRILSGIFDNELLQPVSAGIFNLPASGPHGGLTVTFQQGSTRLPSCARPPWPPRRLPSRATSASLTWWS